MLVIVSLAEARAYMSTADVLGEDGWAVGHGSVVSAVAVVRKYGLRWLHAESRVSTKSRENYTINSEISVAAIGYRGEDF
jgi:hypothetical protein